MYNLEIESRPGEITHNYFVGSDGVLVHNAKSAGGLNNEIRRGRAPRGVIRADPPRIPHEKPHVHLDLPNGGTCALNDDGTWKHPPRGKWKFPRKILDWLLRNGWNGPR